MPPHNAIWARMISEKAANVIIVPYLAAVQVFMCKAICHVARVTAHFSYTGRMQIERILL